MPTAIRPSVSSSAMATTRHRKVDSAWLSAWLGIVVTSRSTSPIIAGLRKCPSATGSRTRAVRLACAPDQPQSVQSETRRPSWATSQASVSPAGPSRLRQRSEAASCVRVQPRLMSATSRAAPAGVPTGSVRRSTGSRVRPSPSSRVRRVIAPATVWSGTGSAPDPARAMFRRVSGEPHGTGWLGSIKARSTSRAVCNDRVRPSRALQSAPMRSVGRWATACNMRSAAAICSSVCAISASATTAARLELTSSAAL